MMESELVVKCVRNIKLWVFGYRTAAFAFLVIAYRFVFEGWEVLIKDEF